MRHARTIRSHGGPGLANRAPDLNTLFAEAAECLVSAFVEDLTTIRPVQSFEFECQGDDRALLLFDWLKHLLYRFDAEGLLFSRFEVNVREGGFTARMGGEPLDPARHPLTREVKAITYHDLLLEQRDGGWLAEVIVDI
ncbi:MAG: archease [Gemmataceae bacterium]